MFDEIRAELAEAVEELNQAGAAAVRAAFLAEQAAGRIARAFEGTGRADLLDAKDRAYMVAVNATDVQVEAASVGSLIQEIYPNIG